MSGLRPIVGLRILDKSYKKCYSIKSGHAIGLVVWSGNFLKRFIQIAIGMSRPSLFGQYIGKLQEQNYYISEIQTDICELYNTTREL